MSAAAVPDSATERAELFAQCAGNLEAEAEHLRHQGAGEVAQVEDQAQMFDLMLDATKTDEMRQGSAAIQLRILRFQSEFDQELLITRATYGVREADRIPARDAAERRSRTCRALLLGG